MLPALLFAAMLAQDGSFDAASIKLSQHPVGPDYNNKISITGTGLRGSNVTLKRLIGEAYGLQPHQVSGGPSWLDSTEYEIEATSGRSVTREETRSMLRRLLEERFRLATHNEAKEMRAFELVVDKNGPKIRPAKDGDAAAATEFPNFHGSLQQFANVLAVQLSIPVMDDPGKPGMASGGPLPVIDRTGLPGIYDFRVEARPEPGGDMITLWQRILQDQLGLRLENRKTRVEILVVDRVERTPSAN
jgi:uncharacterized protein (TIGR03435 family)